MLGDNPINIYSPTSALHAYRFDQHIFAVNFILVVQCCAVLCSAPFFIRFSHEFLVRTFLLISMKDKHIYTMLTCSRSKRTQFTIYVNIQK